MNKVHNNKKKRVILMAHAQNEVIMRGKIVIRLVDEFWNISGSWNFLNQFWNIIAARNSTYLFLVSF